MHLRYKFRIYPTPAQQLSLARAFGCARVVFNDALCARIDARESGLPYPTDGQLSRRIITEAKKTPERAWLSEVSSVVLQQALADLNAAYRNFFASLSGKRKGRKFKPPRFRSRKDNRQSIRFTRSAGFKISDGRKLSLPKIGKIEIRLSRELPAEPSSVTIIKDASDRYFASFVVQTVGEPLTAVDSEVGIDLGLTAFAVLSDGTVIENPRLLRRAQHRIAKAQRAAARKQKGSNNRRKTVRRVARLHTRIADARRDFRHQASTRIIRENQAVYVENLAVNGLARTRLAKSVHDAGWSAFVSMLEYKAIRHERTFHRVDRWFPSTKMCSTCGTVGESLPLNVRDWTCIRGSVHDRDHNAAKNILAAGRAESLNACGARVSPAAMPAQRGEAGTRRDSRQAVVANPGPRVAEDVKTTFSGQQHSAETERSATVVT
ncbi:MULTISPECIES: RNA-guided endonuclease TnpB family protein [unclassified Rhodococcus (in: high G+C Gram-positive bacteria)]|uniref:RNA-guided endonuclease InsQ/TnpB family protein n=1 Tax=unclassified Rhodococcus (in: high G+C Gram-positive bacteria) TaxID=192944 RepID=UPI00289D3584|nr:MULTISPECIES: RNA-guided endonuclease TnpB family protein [unclassified Rhodococcus (in: high G+C Gram-positive bacteria)]